MIGSICGSVAFAFLIIGLVIFIVRWNSKNNTEESESILNFDSSSSSNRREKQTEYIDKDITELAINDEDDKWI